MTPKQLKKYREKLKLTHKDISSELEVCPRFWCYRESGVKAIPRWLARAVRDLVKNPKKRA